MSDTRQAPEQTLQGRVADAVRGNWVDGMAPPASRPYLRLSRADRPVGTWLLLLPCWWGVLLSAASGGGLGWLGAWIVAGCAVGAFLMRGAGCTWNDITDRDIDGSVARTASRPIPSGQVSLRGAVIWMCVQSLLAFGILLTFNGTAIALGIGSLALVCIYPFAKRFTWWPQIFLGLAFNWGALLAWTAHHGALHPAAVALYLGGIGWTLFYDTIYAHQDREDDALIGVKSTARLFGTGTARWLRAFQVGTVAMLALAVWLAFPAPGAGAAVAMAGPFAMGAHMHWQLRKLDIDDTDGCLRLFRSNRDAGLLVVAAFGLAVLLAGGGPA
jgi:4-hydroxybenzoate polyprenyltransferase